MGTCSMIGSTKPSTISRVASDARQPAAHQVEQLLLVHLADRRAMRAAKNVARRDLQVGNRVGAGRAAEQEIAVLLVGGGLLPRRMHPNQAGEDRARLVRQHALEEQVTHARLPDVVLQSVAVEMLVAVLDVEAEQLHIDAVALQHRLDAPLGELAAQLDGLERDNDVSVPSRRARYGSRRPTGPSAACRRSAGSRRA